MMRKPRFVLDNNVLISALLLEYSTPAHALKKAETTGSVLYSYQTLAELSDVLTRPKFSRYITTQELEGLLMRIHRTWENVIITHTISQCRDPKDDMWLELAVNGEAAAIITGDNDLLALTPYRNIPIISPSFFMGI